MQQNKNKQSPLDWVLNFFSESGSIETLIVITLAVLVFLHIFIIAYIINHIYTKGKTDVN